MPIDPNDANKHVQHGDRVMGLQLRHVRQFVADTADWDEDAWMDCQIPSQTPNQYMTAALMGLVSFREEKSKTRTPRG